MCVTYAALLINTPLLLAMCLLAIAIVSGVVCAIARTKWLMYALFLVFLGGIIVVFIYSTALSGNTKLRHIAPNYQTMILSAIAALLVLPPTTALTHKSTALAAIYANQVFMAPCALIVLLLIALFIVVKTVESFKGALVKHFA